MVSYKALKTEQGTMETDWIPRMWNSDYVCCNSVCRIQEVVIGSNSYLNTLFASNKCFFLHLNSIS